VYNSLYTWPGAKAGLNGGPEYLALRRRVTIGATSQQARLYASAVAERLRSFVAEDERANANVPDAPARANRRLHAQQR